MNRNGKTLKLQLKSKKRSTQSSQITSFFTHTDVNSSLINIPVEPIRETLTAPIAFESSPLKDCSILSNYEKNCKLRNQRQHTSYESSNNVVKNFINNGSKVSIEPGIKKSKPMRKPSTRRKKVIVNQTTLKKCFQLQCTDFTESSSSQSNDGIKDFLDDFQYPGPCKPTQFPTSCRWMSQFTCLTRRNTDVQKMKESTKIQNIIDTEFDVEPEYNEVFEYVVTSNILREMLLNTPRILARNYNGLHSTESMDFYYVSNLEIPRSTSFAGVLLKDWSKLPGRDISLLENYKLGNSILKCDSLSPSSKENIKINILIGASTEDQESSNVSLIPPTEHTKYEFEAASEFNDDVIELQINKSRDLFESFDSDDMDDSEGTVKKSYEDHQLLPVRSVIVEDFVLIPDTNQSENTVKESNLDIELSLVGSVKNLDFVPEVDEIEENEGILRKSLTDIRQSAATPASDIDFDLIPETPEDISNKGIESYSESSDIIEIIDSNDEFGIADDELNTRNSTDKNAANTCIPDILLTGEIKSKFNESKSTKIIYSHNNSSIHHREADTLIKRYSSYPQSNNIDEMESSEDEIDKLVNINPFEKFQKNLKTQRTSLTDFLGTCESYKKKYLIEVDNINEMPDYDSMSTRELKECLLEYGIKPLDRLKAIPLLKHIYNQTHPLVDLV